MALPRALCPVCTRRVRLKRHPLHTAYSWFRWHRNLGTHGVCTNSLAAIP